MTEIAAEPHEPARTFPEGVANIRQAGWIDAERLPWLDSAKPRSLTELQFVHGGVAYIASAGTAALNKVTQKVREQDPVKDSGYRKTDELFLRAASLKAGGRDTESSAVSVRVRGIDPTYETGFSVEAMHESPRPNTRRIYFATTLLSNVMPQLLDGVVADPSAPLLVRLALTDKQNQIRTLGLLTGNTRTQMRKWGAGTI